MDEFTACLKGKGRSFGAGEAIRTALMWLSRSTNVPVTIITRKLTITMKFTALLLALSLSACAAVNNRNNTSQLSADSQGIFVTNYRDFGPPQLASKLIGNKWWQWPDPDNHKPVSYDVKVVVYRDIPLAQVKASFPVTPSKKQDYRYVAYEDAVEYFDTTIARLLDDMRSEGNDLEEIVMISTFPLSLYQTVVRMERKLRL